MAIPVLYYESRKKAGGGLKCWDWVKAGLEEQPKAMLGSFGSISRVRVFSEQLEGRLIDTMRWHLQEP